MNISNIHTTDLFAWHAPLYQHLTEQNSTNRLPHGNLLHGIKGVGKLIVAYKLAARLLCKSASTTPCGSCASCQLLQGGFHPDLQYIDRGEKTVIVVETVRKMIDAVAQKSHQNGNKIIIINDSHLLHKAAENALLKVIEEPFANTYIFLLTPSLHQIMPTIRSRMQKIAVPAPTQQQAHAWIITTLQQRAGSDQIDLALIDDMLVVANNAPLQALAMLQVQPRIVVDAIAALQPTATYDGIQQLRAYQPIDVLSVFAMLLHDVLAIHYQAQVIKLQQYRQSIQALADMIDNKKVARLFDGIYDGIRQLQFPIHPNSSMLLMSFLTRWQQCRIN